MHVLFWLTLVTLSTVVQDALSDVEQFEVFHADGSKHRYAAVISHPQSDRPARGAVMLLGGSLASDQDWTVPGSVEHEGETTRLTITGEATRDAELIAESLARRGFVVMRFSLIRDGDPLAELGPGFGTPIPLDTGVEIARAARDWFRGREPAAKSGVFLLGHSLGAVRAAAITNEEVHGLVLLAGAYTSPTNVGPGQLVAQAEQHPATPDFDGSGSVSAWEYAARARLEGVPPDDPSEELRPGIPWVCDVIRDQRVPTLALFGGLDPISVHGPWLERLAEQRKLDLTVEYHPELGHQLGKEQDGLAGPIDPAVVKQIGDWLVDRARPDQP